MKDLDSSFPWGTLSVVLGAIAAFIAVVLPALGANRVVSLLLAWLLFGTAVVTLLYGCFKRAKPGQSDGFIDPDAR